MTAVGDCTIASTSLVASILVASAFSTRCRSTFNPSLSHSLRFSAIHSGDCVPARLVDTSLSVPALPLAAGLALAAALAAGFALAAALDAGLALAAVLPTGLVLGAGLLGAGAAAPQAASKTVAADAPALLQTRRKKTRRGKEAVLSI